MSRRYYLRSKSLPEFNAGGVDNPIPNAPVDEVLTEGTSASTFTGTASSVGRRFSSPFFRGFTTGPIFDPAFSASFPTPIMSTPGNAGGGLPGDIRENQISSSQEGLHNLGENEGMFHPLGFRITMNLRKTDRSSI